MCLSKKHALELMNLGFRRQHFEDDVYPTDVFEYEGNVWVIGGRILPAGDILCSEDIYTQGNWLPNQEDLINWLENNDCTFSIEYDGIGYKSKIAAINGKVYKGKGGTLEYSLYNAIIQLLIEFGGNPVYKSCRIVEAEYIDREDL